MAVAELAAARRAPGGALATRVLTGAVLIAVALAAVWAGGLAFTALVAVAALLMFAEWCVMHGIARGFRQVGLAILAVTVALANYGSAVQAGVCALAGGVLLGLFARGYDRRRAVWLGAGVVYCGLPVVALIALRGLPQGFALTVWTLAIVWATDIFAYFAGRTIGGAKLAPAISPNKTWSGLVGGMAGAALTAWLLARGFGGSIAVQRYALFAGPLLAVAAQGGDLFESGMKRRAGIKDSGTLLPGHGGVLDRLDGLVPVAVLSAAGFAWALA